MPDEPAILDALIAAGIEPSVTYGEQGRASMIQFCLPSGDRIAISYHQLLWCECRQISPAGNRELITMHFRDHMVRMEGTRLEKLFDAILEQEVRAVRVSDPVAGQRDEAAAIVFTIAIRPR